ncbi:hypothetical protein CASFOL_008310 [Castilleja foliolosa]|uniref:Uncharacterized protein n=1 Tax=Castilleja foliolosa TaxID=1961234 RepID=A0ABD3E0A0_9LAMI
MSLRKSGSEAKIIDHRTDKDYGDYVPEIKSKQEDKTFQDMLSVFVDCHPEIKSNWESGKFHDKTFECIFSRPDMLSVFVDCHPEIKSNWESGKFHDKTFECIFSRPVPPSEEFGYKLKMDETRSPSQDVLSKWKSGTVNDMTCLGIFPVPADGNLDIVVHVAVSMIFGFVPCDGPANSIKKLGRIMKLFVTAANFDVLDPALPSLEGCE